MSRSPNRRAARFTWRTFCARDGRRIEKQLAVAAAPCCPCCGEILEARPDSRVARRLPLDATGYDLDCRDCRRFWCVVRHTARSLRLMRMRRLAAAVRAVDTAIPMTPSAGESVPEASTVAA